MGQLERLACTVVVRHGEKEIYRQSESLGTPGLLKMVEAARLSGHTEAVETVVACPDGRLILSGSSDRTMILWDRKTAG